jgi:hypothetical protein
MTLDLERRFGAVALGEIPGAEVLTVMGENRNPGTTNQVVVADAQGQVYPYPAAAVQLDLLPANAADTLAGTGAQKVTVEGIDDNFAEVSETIDLNGASIVTTVASFFRVNKAFVSQAGSGETNAGKIEIFETATANLLGQLSAGRSRTLSGLYAVPAGKRFIIYQLQWSGLQGNNLYIRRFNRLLVRTENRYIGGTRLTHLHNNRNFMPPLVYEEKESFECRMRSTNANSNYDVKVFGILQDM